MNPGAAQVLDALLRARDRVCSGESLSETLGVSRAQIWKHVEPLRARGYEIPGEPGGGYRLAAPPDRLYPELIAPRLHTRWLARSFHWHETTDSTNRVASELARAGAAHGATVVAEGQTAGRGRLGRSFFSPPFQNLYTSIVLRPALDTAAAPTTILAAAIAVADTLSDALGSADPVEIKWPNDVLVRGRKATGILMEMGSEATRVHFLVLGVGVNLNVDPERFPDEFRGRATSLAAELGRPVDRVGFAARLYDTLEAVLDRHAEGGFGAVRPRFEAYFRMVGRPVEVLGVDGRAFGGHAAGIDGDGALVVQCHDGSTERVVAGDVTLAKSPATQRVQEGRSER